MLSSSLSSSPSLFPFTTTSTSSFPFLSTLSTTSVSSCSSSSLNSFTPLRNSPSPSSSLLISNPSERYKTALRDRILHHLTQPHLLYLPSSLPASLPFSLSSPSSSSSSFLNPTLSTSSWSTSKTKLGSRSLPLPSPNCMTLRKVGSHPLPFSFPKVTMSSASVQWKRKQALQTYRQLEKMKGLV